MTLYTYESVSSAWQIDPRPVLVRAYDLRHLRTAQKCKLDAHGLAVLRQPQDVTAVMLHQAAARFAVPRRAADPELALAKRALRVACHAMTFHGVEGPAFFVKSAPLAYFVQHGNGANAFSLGMEVDGLYAGLGTDPRTVWQHRTPTTLTEDVIEAARACLVYLVREGCSQGMPIRTLLAHRQTSGKRRSDPGELLWKEVGLWVARQLDLELQPLATWDSKRDGRGRPIPIEWGNPHGGPY